MATAAGTEPHNRQAPPQSGRTSATVAPLLCPQYARPDTPSPPRSEHSAPIGREMAKISAKCSSFTRCCRSIMADPARTSKPPNSSNGPERAWRLGCGNIRRRGGDRRESGARPMFAVFPLLNPPAALFFSALAPYIEGAGSPAMEINDRRNKPFGPGGSTRRLHPSPPFRGGFRRGRNRIDEGVKGEFFLGMVPPLSGYAIVANDNYAPVAQAA